MSRIDINIPPFETRRNNFEIFIFSLVGFLKAETFTVQDNVLLYDISGSFLKRLRYT
jgi:hypothetical protein